MIKLKKILNESTEIISNTKKILHILNTDLHDICFYGNRIYRGTHTTFDNKSLIRQDIQGEL